MAFERLIFVSGQGGVDPATGSIAADVEAQTEQVLKNIQAILRAAGSDLRHVLRCGVFLLDMTEFTKMNGVYARRFGDHRPARTTVQVAGLPGDGLRVEIDAVMMNCRQNRVASRGHHRSLLGMSRSRRCETRRAR